MTDYTFSAEYKPTDSHQKTIYCGRLWKPRTWLTWEKVNVVKSMKLHSVSLVSTKSGKSGNDIA